MKYNEPTIERTKKIVEGLEKHKTAEQLKITDYEILCFAYDSMYRKEENNEQK